MNFEIFCLHVTGYSNTKESFQSCIFDVMASGKCELHTYFTFLQRNLISTHMKKFNIFLHNICLYIQHSLFKFRLHENKILLYFSSLLDYWPPTTLISLVHNSLGEMVWCGKRAFQLLKMRKIKVSRNIETKCVRDILLKVRSSSMKDYTCHYVEST